MKKKNFFKKRILPILIVLGLLLSIYIYTNVSVNAQVNRTQVFVTKTDIPPRTEITSDMVEPISVPQQGIPANAVTNKDEIVGKWTLAGYGISSHSYIYENKVVEKSDMPDEGILKLEEGEVAYPLLVDLETSLGNSIIPDSKVDLYFQSLVSDETDSSQKAIYGKLASQVRVVSVKDADASNVFDPEGYQQGEQQEDTTSNEQSVATIYVFAIPEELNELLSKAKLLGQVVPVANGSDNVDEETLKESQITDFIKESSVKLDSEEGEQ
ncbi:Flp pilus assembly protein CpaB [Terribacillus saccharophilus]|uniref:Flp pilus assembly protein CpaB n=1 Tax=Terribacillus saccharophilus TaxID=361277 RepID=UPI002989F7DD|nr:RcpC/CpaB family pilus assembly protein [Terribacillus saccharophilus]MCM3227702.1 RcpC/CpaB family pilus assembly protein [Terribacillus saccharophilus]